MKFLVFIFLLSSSLAFAQTEYYSTNGQNAFSEAKLEEIKADLSQSYTASMGRKMYAGATITQTRRAQDSIIHTVKFEVTASPAGSATKRSELSKLIDQPFPVAYLRTPDGGKFDTSSLQGKPTLINFWFTKCAPCVDEMPVLNKIRDQYRGKVNFVAISYESPEVVAAFLKSHNYSFTQLTKGKQLVDMLGIKNYPTNMFLDSKGVIKAIEGGIPYEVDGNTGKKKMGDGYGLMSILNSLQ